MIGKSLAVSLFVLFALSAAYLFSVNERGLDPNQGKNWWSVSFAEPTKDTSFAFVISNHTATNQFRYTVSAPEQTLVEGEVTVESGDHVTHVPSVNFMPTSGRIMITVTHEDRAETIYRSL